MRTVQFVLLCLGVGLAGSVFSETKPTTAKVMTDQEKLSYSLGVMTGQTFRTHGINLDAKFFSYGFYDAFNGKKTALTDQEIQKIVQDFQKKSQQQARDKIQAESQINQQKGEAFLQQNKKKPGVVTLASGLQYKVITMGKGPTPLVSDTVVVDYEGRLINGTVFDSSYRRGQPASFPINQVIEGWQEALQRMPMGSVWELYVPASLAYADTDVPNIGPNQVLIFKIHLLSIKAR